MLLTPPLSATPLKPTVTWAGVGFSGNWGERQSTYPYTSSFFCSNNRVCGNDTIESWARDRILEGDASDSFNFNLQLGLIDAETLDKIGMAIAISNESLTVEEIAVSGSTSFLTNYSIAGSTLFFDLTNNKLIYSAPLITRYTTVYESLPSEDAHRQIFLQMLSDKTLGINFFDEMKSRLAYVNFETKPSAYLKITDASFADGVHDRFSEHFSVDRTERFLATFFENVFSRETGYALIPNSVGHAIGNKIATRLPSGDLTITLPDPGYTMTLNVSKLLFQRKPGRGSDSLCWGARVEWRLNELVFGNETIGSVDLKNVNCAVVHHDSMLSHDAEYVKLVMGMLEMYAKQFKAQDSKWLAKNTDDSKSAKIAIDRLNAVFAQ